MTIDLTMTMRDVFHKMPSGVVIIDSSYAAQDDVMHGEANEFFLMLANVCKRADDGVIVPFADKSYPSRIRVSHTWNYKQIEITFDNGTFTSQISARYSWSIEETLRLLEARYVSSWSQHLERIGRRKYYDADHLYDFVEWFNNGTDNIMAVVVPPSAIWGKPSIQRLTDKNAYEEVTGNFRNAHRLLTAVQETNKGVGVVFTFTKVAGTSTTLRTTRVSALVTDGQNKVTQNVSWESTDVFDSVCTLLSTFFTRTPLKMFSKDTAQYTIKEVTATDAVHTLLTTERPKVEKSESSVIRTTYGSPTFEEDIRNWIIMQAEEMGVA